MSRAFWALLILSEMSRHAKDLDSALYWQVLAAIALTADIVISIAEFVGFVKQRREK